jgi:hypothetical protein
MCGKLFIRHAFWTFAALLVPLLVPSAQQAAPAHYMQQQSATAQEFENFDDFLDSHPQIAKDLSKNPSLANDEEYCKRHPQLAKFLQQHGGVKRELIEHPERFIEREERWEHSGGNIKRGELRSLDGFFDRNPQIEKELQRDPNLVNNPQYVNSHPELKRYIENNPKIAADLKENPRAFIRKERTY